MGIKQMKSLFKLFLIISILALFVGCGGGGGGGGSGDGGVKGEDIYSISGSVTLNGSALQGVTVTLSGAGSEGTATTDASGNYTFTGISDGIYSLKPSMDGYSFNPMSTSQTVNGGNIAHVDFTGSLNTSFLWIADFEGNLGYVDVLTGTVKIIGNMGVTMTDIAFDPQGNLYGVTFSSFYSIDKTTAAATKIGDLGISLNSLTFDSTGKLYGATDRLYTVNPSTGEATLIGNGGVSYSSQGDLAFVDSRLYLTSGNSLIELNTSTGSGSLVGSMGFSYIMALASDSKGNLYGVSGTEIVSLDPKTGVGTELFDYAGQGLNDAWGAAYNMGTLNGGSLRFPVEGSGWSFTSGSYAHTVDGGYLNADDRYAFDLNIADNADKDMPVFPVCPGEVIISDTCWGYVLIKHCTPLMLDDGKILSTWYSGYMHMANPIGLGHVDGTSQIGTVSGWGRNISGVCSSTGYNDHLHFVAYTGTPVSGSLISVDIANQLRRFAQNISIWINWCGSSAQPAQDEPWWGDGEYPCD